VSDWLCHKGFFELINRSRNARRTEITPEPPETSHLPDIAWRKTVIVELGDPLIKRNLLPRPRNDYWVKKFSDEEESDCLPREDSRDA
jgi:hypothetical protein